MGVAVADTNKITNDFSYYEFGCHCNRSSCPEKSGKNIDHEFVMHLQMIRDEFGKPMIISSGIRCSEHNREVGGVLGSFHTVFLGAKAADILVSDPKDRHIIVRLATELGLSVGIAGHYIHLDSRQEEIIFLY